MKYEDSRRLRGVESVWLRLRLWLMPAPRPRKTPLITNLSHLSDHEREDIGIPEPVRYLDWQSLKDRGLTF
ncbi:hypothetical protein [Microvirga thermotolerans]|uniref:DUF1127 domain-containing protein n=1 Tax=Microvirga thermotolerans TaxID=2651334 RepID=A0A5P9JVN5_9HYPH|nr:hypothetical protein [Microvirga thermotolerans]QFU16493.1 hypothetical protein GDR74_09765 [Microvirga thermotolerans]